MIYARAAERQQYMRENMRAARAMLLKIALLCPPVFWFTTELLAAMPPRRSPPDAMPFLAVDCAIF